MAAMQETNQNMGSSPAGEGGRYAKSYPMPTYNFRVYLETHCIGFSKITSIVESVETETLQEGGVNDRVYSVRKPTSQEKTLVFERGALLNDDTFEAQFRFDMGRRLGCNILICVMDRDGGVGRAFEVTGAMIKKVSYSDLDSLSNQTLIETFEVSYETLDALKIPAP